MKYIRTKDGIVDLEKFINEEKDTPYYKDFEFEEISKDGKLKWTAIGTEKCSIKNQIGRRCHFYATLNSEVINQADTIEELCDEFVSNNKLLEPKYVYTNETLIQSWRNRFEDELVVKGNKDIKGAIWTDKGLIYVAKMNNKGELELL